MKEYKNRNVPSIKSIGHVQYIYSNKNKIILHNIFNNFDCVFKNNRGDYKHAIFRVLFPTDEKYCNVLFDGEAIVSLYEYNYYNNIDDNLSLKDICEEKPSLKCLSERKSGILV